MRHLLKSVWVHRGQSFLVGAELLLSFLVLCGVAIAALAGAGRYGTPLGFEYQDVWHVQIAPGYEAAQRQEDVLREATAFDEVLAAAMVSQVPFDDDPNSRFILSADGTQMQPRAWAASDNLPDVLGLRLVAGRWFGPEDDASEPAVINAALGRKLFGAKDAVGRRIEWGGMRRGAYLHVVGVVERFRTDELAADAPFLFERARAQGFPATELLVRVRPGTKAVFGERLSARLRVLGNGWGVSIDPLPRHRAFRLKWQTILLAGVSLISALLLLMVALGLVGVLWQSVAARTHEIGVRLAAGAPAAAIYLQFAGEALVITTFAVVLGTALLVQVFALHLVESAGASTIAAGLAGSTLLLYAMVLASVAFPCHVATRVRPAEALRHE